ncbi:hypothetical protein BS47DRAFT_1443710 [Hydnum rufescens UP504]|uniref:Uncharacterized protein n=1 Tax=Hydnum rufescens UP504 TaxID=1448309 RepID=A0A9P6B234_9AGAM|nr:hypothetical protein BS47DRAFT_1443710 [Hydnum rufescens UP504]
MARAVKELSQKKKAAGLKAGGRISPWSSSAEAIRGPSGGPRTKQFPVPGLELMPPRLSRQDTVGRSGMPWNFKTRLKPRVIFFGDKNPFCSSDYCSNAAAVYCYYTEAPSPKFMDFWSPTGSYLAEIRERLRGKIRLTDQASHTARGGPMLQYLGEVTSPVRVASETLILLREVYPSAHSTRT